MTESSSSVEKGLSKIQFKRSLSKRFSSADKTIRKTSGSARKSISAIDRSSSNLSNVLDPSYCYHPECSFAYNITKDHITRPSFITECLPFPTYQRLAKLWNLDPEKTPLPHANRCRKKNLEEEDQMVEEFIKSVEKELGIRSDVSTDLQLNACSEPTDVADAKREEEKKEPRKNPYARFLKTDRDSKAKHSGMKSLQKDSGRITKKIIRNFLAWYQSLGGNDEETFIEDSMLQELFQIGFEMPAAKALAIKVIELATVPKCLAVLRNEPKHANSYALKQFLKEDIRLENIPLKMYAFGKVLPKERPSLRFVPPKNNVKKTWMECSRVSKDLDTMKTVWQGLEQLRSTIAFSDWLKGHPEIKPPPYLEEMGIFKINYEAWNQMYRGFEMDVGIVEVVTSDMKINQEKISVQEMKSLGSVSTKNISSMTF